MVHFLLRVRWVIDVDPTAVLGDNVLDDLLDDRVRKWNTCIHHPCSVGRRNAAIRRRSRRFLRHMCITSAFLRASHSFHRHPRWFRRPSRWFRQPPGWCRRLSRWFRRLPAASSSCKRSTTSGILCPSPSSPSPSSPFASGTTVPEASSAVSTICDSRNTLWLCSRPPKSKIPQERQTQQNNSPSKQGRSPLIAGGTGRTTSRTRIISYPFGRDAASSVPQPAGCQDYQAGRISWPGAVREVLLPSRCAQGLGKSHQCYLTNANPPAACGPTAAAYMMRTAP